MFYFKGTRKTDFRNININKSVFDVYWQDTGSTMRSKLMEREIVFFDWIKPNTRVLNIGCGNSRLLYELRNKKLCQVNGLDFNKLVVEMLNKNDIPSFESDVNHQNFNLNNFFNFKFDYIVMSELLHQIPYPENLINKIKSFSKYIIISIPNSAFYRYRWHLMFKGKFFTQWSHHPSETLRYWSHTDFLTWLEALNLEVIKFKASNGFQGLKDLWPNMFGHQICYLVKEKT